MLEALKKDDFDLMYALMRESFPKEEYRPYAAQRALWERSAYTVYALYGERGALQAFLSAWEFPSFVYWEHLAVQPTCRNGGIGGGVLAEARKRTDKTICLEVEPPQTELAKRRIAFYERNGFSLNAYEYMQPSMGEGRRAIPLLLMTTGGDVSPARFAEMRATLYREVYGVR